MFSMRDKNVLQERKEVEVAWSDFLEMVEVFAGPVSNYYQGPLVYNGGAIWESLHKELVFRAKSVLLVEKKKTSMRFSD